MLYKSFIYCYIFIYYFHYIYQFKAIYFFKFKDIYSINYFIFSFANFNFLFHIFDFKTLISSYIVNQFMNLISLLYLIAQFSILLDVLIIKTIFYLFNLKKYFLNLNFYFYSSLKY